MKVGCRDWDLEIIVGGTLLGDGGQNRERGRELRGLRRQGDVEGGAGRRGARVEAERLDVGGVGGVI